MLNRKILLGFCAILWASLAHAQLLAPVVTSCGTQSYTLGTNRTVVQDVTGNLCTSSVGGSIGSISNTSFGLIGNSVLAYVDANHGVYSDLMDIKGAAVDTGSGTGGSGTQRIIIDSAQVNGNGAATVANSAPVTPSNKPVGSAALATNQASCPITTASSMVSARTGVAGTGRISVTITNITGTHPIYVGNTGVTTGNGQYIPAVAGASLTLDTQAAIFCIADTGAQTISWAESY